MTFLTTAFSEALVLLHLLFKIIYLFRKTQNSCITKNILVVVAFVHSFTHLYVVFFFLVFFFLSTFYEAPNPVLLRPGIKDSEVFLLMQHCHVKETNGVEFYA